MEVLSGLICPRWIEDTTFLPNSSKNNLDCSARLASIAATSGGAMLPKDSLRATVDRLSAGLPSGSRGISPWLIFALLLAAAGAEWGLRRLGGRA